MATIKSYTDLEQSKKLAEFLPIESADMYYYYNYDFDEVESIPTITEEDDHFILFPKDVPCWSLATLLEIIADVAARIDEDGYVDVVVCKDVHSVSLINCNGEQGETDNLVDACVEMIMRLHELNLL